MRCLHGILGAPAHLPDLVRRRMQLPGRHFGLGYRNREELISPAAFFVSGFIEAHERFLTGEKGIGFFPQLEGLLGSGAFDNGGGRFTYALDEGETVPQQEALQAYRHFYACW